MGSGNYLKLESWLPCSSRYIYVDTQDYLADRLFVQARLRVRYSGEFARKGSPYVIISCKVRKKDEGRFIKMLEKLPDRMLLMGHTDYMEYCRELIGNLGAGREGPKAG